MTLLKNVPLKKYSNYKIGGAASYFHEFRSREDLIAALSEFAIISPKGRVFVLGKGTNVLFSDNGFDGLVLKNNFKFIQRDGSIVSVGSGTLMEDLVTFCCRNSLSGLEWAGGLPGTVGGAVRGNAGAFLGETADNIYQVESLNLKNLKIVNRNKKDCLFGYRQSVFKNEEGKNEIILLVRFKLKKGDSAEIKSATQKKIDHRIDRHPLDLPNIGSTFKNVDLKQVSKEVRLEFKDSIKHDPFPVIPVAKLIVSAGFMGKTLGGAMVSKKHPNFIVNFNNAKERDVRSLIDLMKKEIKRKYNISLEEEIMCV